MRAYKTRPWLWSAASLVVFIAIGFAVRWDTDGEGMVSLAGAMIDYFTALAGSHDKVLAEPFRFLLVWIASAILLGWLLQSLLVMLMFSREKPKPSP